MLQSKIEIGKVNFSLIDDRNILNKKVLEINCENVLISEYTLKSRSLHMECEQGKNNLILLKADIAEKSPIVIELFIFVAVRIENEEIWTDLPILILPFKIFIFGRSLEA